MMYVLCASPPSILHSYVTPSESHTDPQYQDQDPQYLFRTTFHSHFFRIFSDDFSFLWRNELHGDSTHLREKIFLSENSADEKNKQLHSRADEKNKQFVLTPLCDFIRNIKLPS